MTPLKAKTPCGFLTCCIAAGGFPANPQYPNKAVAGGLSARIKARRWESSSARARVSPGSKHIYGDISICCFGFIVESVTGQPLDRYVEESIYRPLGLTHTVFNPLLKGFKPQQIAATELNGNTRDGVIHCRYPAPPLSGVRCTMKKPFIRWAAGFRARRFSFSNTGDIAVLMQTMLNGGGYGDVQLFSAETVKMFTTSSKEDATFGLGWRVNGNATMTPTFGTLASPQTYGHTGWTGTVTVIDPVNHMAIVMLSNSHIRRLPIRKRIRICSKAVSCRLQRMVG
ncbi:serine hydrolase [Escherichia coli]